jgi:peroxiredoxin
MRIQAVILALAASSVALAPDARAAPVVGQPAPAFAVPDTTGKTRTLAELAGKTVVLEWTNHDCPFVRKHYESGNMQALQKRYADPGTVWLSVVSSAPGKQGHVSPAEAGRLTESRAAAPSAVLLDESGAMGRAYDARTTPHMYIITPDGKLAYMGGIDSVASTDQADLARATPYFALAMEEVRAGRPVSNPVTRPYGCSVKY